MNPALNDKTFSGIGYTEERMTVSGVINKSIVLRKGLNQYEQRRRE